MSFPKKPFPDPFPSNLCPRLQLPLQWDNLRYHKHVRGGLRGLKGKVQSERIAFNNVISHSVGQKLRTKKTHWGSSRILNFRFRTHNEKSAPYLFHFLKDDLDVGTKASLVGSITIGTTFFLSPVSGILTDKFGLRKTAMAGGTVVRVCAAGFLSKLLIRGILTRLKCWAKI